MINWGTEIYNNIRREFEDSIFEFPVVYDQKALEPIIKQYNGRIIELRPKPNSIREVTDFLGMNDRYAIQFDSEEDEMMFILKFS